MDFASPFCAWKYLFILLHLYQNRFDGVWLMSKVPRRSPSDRMIHIRLDEETHRLIKVQATQHGLTIQRLVENIIRGQVVTPEDRSSEK